VNDFTKRFGHAPGGNQSNSYAITKAYLAALEATGGDDAYDKFWPALLDVKIDTPQGPLEVSPLGVAIVNIYIVEVKKKDGKYYWEEIRTYPKVLDPRLEA
jgi:ABC-type branched-subunit amino acid transport system substrate-binding protein